MILCRTSTRARKELCEDGAMETVKQNVRVAEQKKRIKAYQDALDGKAGRHEADKAGKRNGH